MKKLLICILAVFMLTGCTREKKTSTFMITRDNTLYALYNHEGKQLTDYSYKTFQEIEGSGYIVTDAKDQKGFISLEGEEIIPFGEYASLEATDQMLYATKNVEMKENDQNKPVNQGLIKSNLYVLNNEGKVLYSADEKTGIIKSGLPIIQIDNQYIVLYHNGEELYKDKQVVQYAYQADESQVVVMGFENQSQFFFFSEEKDKDVELTIKEKGHFKILAYNIEGAVLNDATAKSMIYVDFKNQTYYQNTIGIQEAQFDESGNIMLKGTQGTFVYPIGKAPVLMTSYYLSSYTYVSRSTDIYGPHLVFKDGNNTGELSNCQLYPQPMHVYSEIFPVYQRGKGYQYYNFDNKLVIDKIFLAAEPFDQNERAIVKIKEDGYSLIDNTGKELTEKRYYQIKYIGSSYYAVYNESGMFGILDMDGKELFSMEYTSLPETPVVEYESNTYLVLNKNGRSFVYDVQDDMNEIFSHEGNVIFSDKGYFQIENQYFTFEGEEIK